ncbi:MAG: hypothetical protein GY829_01380 [Gammaproteobacteria bacterium]|nr:hypothetical protein [Gammaproteobacteria bacterium]
MKLFKIIIVVTSLLYSAWAMACNVNITVKNQTGVTLRTVMVTGPCYRESKGHSYMKHNESFTYKAEGSFCSCHGTYRLDYYAGLPHCEINEDVSNRQLKCKKNGSATFTILKEKNGKLCKIAVSKKC